MAIVRVSWVFLAEKVLKYFLNEKIFVHIFATIETGMHGSGLNVLADFKMKITNEQSSEFDIQSTRR